MTDPHRTPHLNVSRRRAGLFAAVLAAAGLCVLIAAPGADAGTYRALQCHEGTGAGHGDATFGGNSPRYAASADCRGAGLGITHEARRNRTAGGRYGAWVIRAPQGAQILSAVAGVRAHGADGHAPQMTMRVAGGERRAIGGVRGERHSVRWSGANGRALEARLTCANRKSCGAGAGAFIYLRRVALTLRDSLRPRLEPRGSLLAPGSRRGGESLTVEASDAGAGVRSVTVAVNGRPLAARSSRCALSGRVALRLSPCPGDVAPGFDIATTTDRFRQGPNLVEICALDFAPRQGANRTCERRSVRVDNACPLSAERGARLRVRFRGAGRRIVTRSDKPAPVTGRLTDATGAPVAGARVCIAARPVATGGPERVLATPTTDAAGRFDARVAPGPSRQVRVAHWPDAERAVEEFLRLAVRPRARLRLRPQRRLTNGERLRFRVAIPGPANARRLVAVQARSGKRWVRIAGGRTSRAGVWRGGYRFRATTGQRRYAFRAIVPKQSGYPYEAGRSAVRRKIVTGG